MPLYIKNQKVPTWYEYNLTDSVNNGNYTTDIPLPSTSGYYGHFFVMWSWDSRTAYPWIDSQNGDGYGFGIIQGTHASGNYVYRDIYSNESALSLSTSKFNIQNNTGDAAFCNIRVQAWSFNPDHNDG
tara:strand:- start:11390 stop:11773 length:384 start_codon:yes stop_codon:yes gene_type:complete